MMENLSIKLKNTKVMFSNKERGTADYILGKITVRAFSLVKGDVL